MNRPEEQLQRAVVSWLHLKFPRGKSDVLWFAVTPQRGTRSRAEMGVLQAIGQLAGVADLQLVWSRKRSDVPDLGFIELKSKAGRQRPSQKDFQAACSRCGAKYAICRSLKEVESTLLEWGIR